MEGAYHNTVGVICRQATGNPIAGFVRANGVPEWTGYRLGGYLTPERIDFYIYEGAEVTVHWAGWPELWKPWKQGRLASDGVITALEMTPEGYRFSFKGKHMRTSHYKDPFPPQPKAPLPGDQTP